MAGRHRRALIAAGVAVAFAAWLLRAHIRPHSMGAWASEVLKGNGLAQAGRAYVSTAMSQDVERILAMPENEPLKMFLERAQPGPQQNPRPEPFRLRWNDRRGQVLYEGCRETGFMDPELPMVSPDVTVTFDMAAAEDMEHRFGCPSPFPDMWCRRELDWAMPALKDRVRAVLRTRGIVYGDERVMIDYAALVEQAIPALEPVAHEVLRRFPRIANQASRPAEVVALVSLVQCGVRYQSIPAAPGWENGGMRSPLMTLRHGGDCDSKCVLLAALLRVVAPTMPIVLIATRGGGPSDPESQNHMMVGLGIPANECDVTVRCGERSYVLVETTDGWGIGVAPDGFDARAIEACIEIPAR